MDLGVITGLFYMDTMWGSEDSFDFLDGLDESYVSHADNQGRRYFIGSVYKDTSDGLVRIVIHNKDTQDVEDSVEIMLDDMYYNVRIRLVELIGG